jgi:hypothetical protein
MRKHVLLVLLLSLFQSMTAAILIGFGVNFASAGTMSYLRLTLNGDLPPLRMTYPDVYRLAADLEKLIERAGEDNKRDCGFTYQIRERGNSLRGNSLNELFIEPTLPSPAHSFEIFCYPYQQGIYSIEVLLTNHRSSYSLVGKDQELLRALQRQIDDFAQRHMTWFGGDVCRYLVFIFINLFAGGLYGAGLYEVLGTKRTTRWSLGLLATGCILLASDFFLLSAGYLDYWFPNTAIYFGSSPPVIRNSPVLRFWFILLAIIALVVAVIIVRKKWDTDLQAKY